MTSCEICLSYKEDFKLYLGPKTVYRSHCVGWLVCVKKLWRAARLASTVFDILKVNLVTIDHIQVLPYIYILWEISLVVCRVCFLKRVCVVEIFTHLQRSSLVLRFFNCYKQSNIMNKILLFFVFNHISQVSCRREYWKDRLVLDHTI